MRELVVISGKGGTGKTSVVASFVAEGRCSAVTAWPPRRSMVRRLRITIRAAARGGIAAWGRPAPMSRLPRFCADSAASGRSRSASR